MVPVTFESICYPCFPKITKLVPIGERLGRNEDGGRVFLRSDHACLKSFLALTNYP